MRSEIAKKKKSKEYKYMQLIGQVHSKKVIIYINMGGCINVLKFFHSKKK